MIILDNIIKNLQSGGGVTVYFDNIRERLIKENLPMEVINYAAHSESGGKQLRFMERYRDCEVADQNAVFHSSYYRLPTSDKQTVITTVHDFTYELFIKGPAQWVHTWQKNRAIKNSRINICVSNNTAKDLLRFCPVKEENIRVIHNGVSDSYYPLTNVPIKTDKVLFVGARGGYKNFELAIKAIALNPELSLAVVGGGDFTQHESALLEQYLPNRYKWLGRLSEEELNTAYNSAYALIYPSSYEGFGIPVAEAMRAGCPVVTVNSSSIPEVAGDAAILIETISVDELADGLRMIDNEREKLIRAGFSQAQKFSWEKCYQETLAIYKEFL